MNSRKGCDAMSEQLQHLWKEGMAGFDLGFSEGDAREG